MSQGYSRYVDTGSPGIGLIPHHWSLCPLKTVTSCNDEVLSESSDPEAEFDYVEISGVEFGKGIVETTRLMFADAPSRARRIVREGDVLVSTVRTYLRAIAQVVQPSEGLIASTGFAVLRPRGIESGFLGYLAVADFLVGEVISRSVGVSYPAINASELVRLKVPLPPLNEQRAIAAFLDQETGKIDALVEAQRRLIALLKEKRQAVISHAVTKGLDPTAPMKDSGVEWFGEIPQHWTVGPLKHISDGITVGIVVEPSKYYVDEGVPALRSLNVRPGLISKDNLVYISEASNEQLAKSKLRAGDLVAVRTGQPGTCAVIPQELDGCNCIDLIIIRRSERVLSDYLSWFLSSDVAVRQFAEGSGGAIQLHFNVSTAAVLKVALPPHEEQTAILAFLNQETGKLDELVAEAEKAIALLQERRSALISAAVTGKIDVRSEVPETTEAA